MTGVQTCALRSMTIFDEMLDRGQPPDVITYNNLIDALCKNGHLDRAIALFNKMKDQAIRPNVYTFTILLDGLCKVERLMNAHEFFQDLLTKGLSKCSEICCYDQ